MQGLVQGQGVRPTIARLAARHRIAGTVCNSSRGVEIEACGNSIAIEVFDRQLRNHFQDAAFVSDTVDAFANSDATSFRIVDSEIGDQLRTTVPTDLVLCQDCTAELRSATDWRGGYPFITCARCGPRYSILRLMPFDRASTTMDAFPMCPRCDAEYRDPSDRRFHAQTVCCPNCGPRCWAVDRDGNQVAGSTNAADWIAQRVSAGEIAAVKGIGGYQLICDATNESAVKALRHRKHRPTKPLPIMVSDVTAATRLGWMNQAEIDALKSSVGPIVLLRAQPGNPLAASVSPNLNTIGVMLPTSALHVILADRVGKPLVVTSGNVHGSPIVYQNDVAQRDLGSIADVFLHHDRDIANPIDDSVVQCVGEQRMTIRAARGMAPLTIPFKGLGADNRIATGGHQKVALALQTRDAIVLGPHIGDMESEQCRVRFVESLSKLGSLYQNAAGSVVHDRHPNYFTTDMARRSFAASESAQHHHAHVAAAMLEHDLLDQTVLGIAFDGTGYGDDATIWGGEALLSTTSRSERIGYLRPFRLPGGELAVKQPWRIGASLRSQWGETSDPGLQYAIDHGPVTSSMGRLFDGVASIVLGIDKVDDEGEAAMRLEAACDWDERSAYDFDPTHKHAASPRPAWGREAGGEGTWEKGAIIDKAQFDWRPVIREIQNDLSRLSPQRIAMKFHRAVANLVVELATQNSYVPTVLCGGVFQNRVLLELIQQTAQQRSLDVRMPGLIPVNDAGLAAGQLVIAGNGGASCA